MKKLLLFFAAVLGMAAQATNTQCPNATGALPHCVVLSWQPPLTGVAPTAYNLYVGPVTNMLGQCSTAASCTKIGTVTLPAPLTFTYNSSTTVTLTEGAVYCFVATALNGTVEGVPSTEVCLQIPFLSATQPSPSNLQATGK